MVWQYHHPSFAPDESPEEPSQDQHPTSTPTVVFLPSPGTESSSQPGCTAQAPHGSQLPPANTAPAAAASKKKKRKRVPSPKKPSAPGPGEEGFDDDEDEDDTVHMDVLEVGYRKSQGRKKIKIEFIPEKRPRQVSFLKRKNGLLKKAHNLSILTGCSLAVVIFNKDNKKMYEYANPSPESVFVRYSNYSGPSERWSSSVRNLASAKGTSDLRANEPLLAAAADAAARMAAARHAHPDRYIFPAPGRRRLHPNVTVPAVCAPLSEVHAAALHALRPPAAAQPPPPPPAPALSPAAPHPPAPHPAAAAAPAAAGTPQRLRALPFEGSLAALGRGEGGAPAPPPALDLRALVGRAGPPPPASPVGSVCTPAHADGGAGAGRGPAPDAAGAGAGALGDGMLVDARGDAFAYAVGEHALDASPVSTPGGAGACWEEDAGAAAAADGADDVAAATAVAGAHEPLQALPMLAPLVPQFDAGADLGLAPEHGRLMPLYAADLGHAEFDGGQPAEDGLDIPMTAQEIHQRRHAKQQAERVARMSAQALEEGPDFSWCGNK